VAIAPEAVEADATAAQPEKSGNAGWIIAIILGLLMLGGAAFIVTRNRR
jgi:LPXTG-motif cell wall-anchored protein